MRQQVATREHFRRGNAVFNCRVIRWSSGAFLLAFKGHPPPVTVDVDFENRSVVDEPIHGGQRHRGIRENLAPCTERLICGDEGGAAFVTGADNTNPPKH
jgi:hypothetical protein